VYGSGRQAYLIRSDGYGLRQITTLAEPVLELALSAMDLYFLLLTAGNRLVRADTATAALRDVIPPTPYNLSVNIGPADIPL